MKKIIIAAACLTLFALNIAAQGAGRMEWFKDAKFGMFIHWGIYTELAGIYGDKTDGGEWMMSSKKIPIKEYSALASRFNPVRFDARDWVGLASKAGQKYLIITAKHHDGFAMYHSGVSSYNIVDATPFGRDVLSELCDACNEEGINTHNNSCVFVEITYRPSDQWTRVDWNCQKPTQGNSRGEQELTGKLKSGWNHIAVSFNQRAFKLYVNDERLCNVPNVLAPKYMEYESVNSEGYPYSCISNVRIGQGAVALYDRNASDIDKAMAETGKFVTNNILFDTGKATLKPESMAEIQKVADYMKKNPTVRFEVQGHTDNQGSDKINDPLSKQRAEAIVKALASLGVDDFNLKAVGKGSHEPVADNKTEEGRAKNRRVEFIKR